MKMNLFSMFNPISSESESMPNMWMTTILLIPIIPVSLWKPQPKSLKTMTHLLMLMSSQLKTMLKKSNKTNTIIMLSTMMSIMMMNMLGMFPFTFPNTSQPQMTMSMACPLWLGLMMMKIKSPTKLLAHMLPPSTPALLTPMMVIIETVSNMIQPITLSIRLMANITAGHILMTLIASSHSWSWMYTMTFTTQMMFTMMEMFVAFIQAYVFSMLLTMYMK